MSHMLLACRALGEAQPVTYREYGRLFDDADVAWRAALLALAMEKPIRFFLDRQHHIVLPPDEQKAGMSGREIVMGGDVLPEAEISTALDTRDGPPIVPAALTGPANT